MVRYVINSTPAGHPYERCRSPREPVCSETPQSASAGCLSSLLLQRLRRGPRPAREQFRGPPRDTRTGCVIAQKLPDPCARRDRAERRTGGPTDAKKAPPVVASRRPHRGSADRPTPHKAGRTPHTRVPRERRAATAPLTPRPTAAVAQDLPHEADAREEDGPEPAHPAVDPHAHGQQDPLELEAAALAPHEARLVESLLKKTCSS